MLGRRLNPFAPPQPLPGIADILIRSTGLSQVPHRRAALDDDRVDLLLRPPVAGFGVLDFKGGIALIEAGYRYAAEALAKSGLARTVRELRQLLRGSGADGMTTTRRPGCPHVRAASDLLARQCSHQGRAAPATVAGERSGGWACRPTAGGPWSGTSRSLRDPTFA